MTAAKFYARQTYKQLNKIYRPAWLPTEQLEIGDFGLLKRRVFQRLASFQDHFGTDIAIKPDSIAAPLDVSYSKQVKIVFKASGETKADLPNIPQAKAGFGAEFSRSGAFIVRAARTYEPCVNNLLELEQRIKERFRAGEWDKSWVIVVKLIRCEAATILISKASGTKLEFSVAGDVPVSGVELGSAEFQFEPESSTNGAFTFVNARDITPFVQLLKLGRKGTVAFPFEAKLAGAEAGPPVSSMDFVTSAAVQDDDQLFESLELVPADDLEDDLEED